MAGWLIEGDEDDMIAISTLHISSGVIVLQLTGSVLPVIRLVEEKFTGSRIILGAYDVYNPT